MDDLLPKDTRKWLYYPIILPLDSAENGPATIEEATSITIEVWDMYCNTHGSFDNLPDAINLAMSLVINEIGAEGSTDTLAVDAKAEQGHSYEAGFLDAKRGLRLSPNQKPGPYKAGWEAWYELQHLLFKFRLSIWAESSDTGTQGTDI